MKKLLLLCIVFAGFSTGISGEVAASPRQYECLSAFGTQAIVQPSISGSKFDGYYCYIPLSAGECIAEADAFGFSKIISEGPSGMAKCTPTVVTDEATGEKYYKFGNGEKFMLE